MAGFTPVLEIELSAPVAKQFAVPGKNPPELTGGMADVVRLQAYEDDFPGRRLMVQFVYGRMVAGKFEPAVRIRADEKARVEKLVLDDQNVVWSGASYREAGFVDYRPVQELTLLEKAAGLFGWSGTIRSRM